MTHSPTAARADGQTRRRLTAPSSSTWGILRHELLFLSFALLEIALITPLILVILGWARYWPPYQVALWLLLIMLIPLNLARLMSLLHFDVKRQRRVLVVALIVTLLLSWRILLYDISSPFDLSWLRLFLSSFGEGGNLLWTRDLSVFLITIFIWWRGIRLAVRHPEINNIGLRLRLGGLIFLPLIVWFSSAFLEISVVPFVLLFFLAALTAVSLVRAENIEEERTGTAATLNVRWFAVVFGAALMIIVTAGILASLVSGDSLFVVMAWLSPLWRALQFSATVAGVTLFEMTYPAFELLAVLVQFLANILGALLGQVSAGLRAANFFQQLPTPDLGTPTATVDVSGTGVADKMITAIIMLGLIVIIALALARAYRQATFAARESDSSRTIRGDDDEPGLGRRVLGRLGLFRGWRAAASVRRIYRIMCRAAAAAGFPRLGTETPYEFLPTLARVWPDYTAETRTITEAFIRVRYGEVPESAEELAIIQSAWHTLETAEPHRLEAAPEQGPTLSKREK